ncbi:hypothetical protein LR48_Vigan06g096100 [Vigna angularis]|uniref:Uncharacterized protein n=1 Tax=Phaseolus angularis TaxID=3914 RepID=A0A0L9US05_PHAAN|nr:hypothetical protein LR48_Vigan06g096100 [Vigna angularis]
MLVQRALTRDQQVDARPARGRSSSELRTLVQRALTRDQQVDARPARGRSSTSKDARPAISGRSSSERAKVDARSARSGRSPSERARLAKNDARPASLHQSPSDPTLFAQRKITYDSSL